MTFVRVALNVPLPRLFDYRADDATAADIGLRVLVPFGSGDSGVKCGLIVDVVASSNQPEEKLKPVTAILRDTPALPPDWLALCEFCSRYYQYPLGQVIALALPPMLRKGKRPKERKAGQCAAAVAPVLPELLPEQEAALTAITSARGFAPFLLHGVTGSGKTEVYLRAIENLLAQGRQALMLVPEIALTPQLEQRVSERFQDTQIVVAHSGIAEAARARGFLDALAERAGIVLGTRLSVFMPLPRLGLIVVDEEHDPSFKQQEGLRYCARDVAIFRAKQLGIPIVLGSATPALETFQHALTRRYHLLELPRRAVAADLPTVRLINTGKEKLQEGMSAALIEALAQRLTRQEQSLVFLNRRGYAPVLACPACGWVSRCYRCAANLVLHLIDKRLRCHHCGIESGIPRACPDCGNQDIHPFGRGTQRLAAALSERFPAARILRIDRDSASTPAQWQSLLAAIHAGAADILIGTQMLAKGHDFPQLTLVGVVGADAALFAADFRAPERLFAQLMQVGGRSGRHDLSGEVLIQTEYPTAPLYRALIGHDYAAFARSQLDNRQAAGFPPFSHQAMLRAEAPEMAQALDFLHAARTIAESLADTALVLYDPVPMRLTRLKNMERGQLLVESQNRPVLQAFLSTWMTLLRDSKTPRALRWHLDVDPVDY
jgi:primosomal protein N' (replication factor Y)